MKHGALVLGLCAVVVRGQEQVEGYTLYPDAVIEGQADIAFEGGSTASLTNCAAHCSSKPGCKGFVHVAAFNHCELWSHTDHQPSSSAGIAFYAQISSFVSDESTLPPPTDSTTADSAPVSTLSDSEVEHITLFHNAMRRRAGAADMHLLLWDASLSALADDKIRFCPTATSTIMGFAGVGMGLGVGGSVEAALGGWQQQEERFVSQKGGGCAAGECGEYRQAVWSASTRMGCAKRMCDGNTHVLCHYTEAADPQEPPFSTGDACTQCVGICDDGLCAPPTSCLEGLLKVAGETAVDGSLNGYWGLDWDTPAINGRPHFRMHARNVHMYFYPQNQWWVIDTDTVVDNGVRAYVRDDALVPEAIAETWQLYPGFGSFRADPPMRVARCPPPTAAPSAAPSAAPPAPTAGGSGGFNFKGCGDGEDSFQTTLTEANEEGLIGVIPRGKVNLRVQLSAANDLDIRLYDADDVSLFDEGQAIVAWCGEPCNFGLLNGPTEGSITYKGMFIEYSGYNGKGGLGNEYVTITGTTSTSLLMAAFAFQPGQVQVNYSWTASTICTGSFQQEVPLNAVVSLGEIPEKVGGLRIQLRAANDIDIQLYDAGRSLTPIVAYCAPGDTDCTEGVLGWSATPESASYEGLTYNYSGYNGEDGKLGHEYIQIQGVSNTPLLMKVFGYAAGWATVSYEYQNN